MGSVKCFLWYLKMISRPDTKKRYYANVSGDGAGDDDGVCMQTLGLGQWNTLDFRVTRTAVEYKSGTIFMIMRLDLMLFLVCVSCLFFDHRLILFLFLFFILCLLLPELVA